MTPRAVHGRLPLICLCGPTASGKTAAALAIAERWPVEIVSVDSALVYRGMDIGTAKPDAQERASVPHHLIDIREPWQPYSAADFARDATQAIDAIRRRGRLPLLVGGTMLYLKALVDGLDPLPQADEALRAELEAQARQHGWPALHAELARVDPATAARLAPADAQRIQRALEVWHLTGQPLSALQRGRPALPAGASKPEPPVIIALEPADRAWLHRRIDERLRQMWRRGFVQEVRQLCADPRIGPELPALRAVGYRQVLECLTPRKPGEGPLEEDPSAMAQLHARCAAATRQLAKRQLTWLRSLPDRQMVACDAENSRIRVLDLAFVHWPSP